jgi:hypothetical protein
MRLAGLGERAFAGSRPGQRFSPIGGAIRLWFGPISFKAHLTFTKTADNMASGCSFRQGGNQNIISQKK